MSLRYRNIYRYLFVFALLACRREDHALPEAKPRGARSAPPGPSLTPPGTATAGPSPSAAPSSDDTASAAAISTVHAWSDALDRHEPEKLVQLYAESVYFYGRKWTRAAVVSSKKAAFDKQPTFHQQIVGPLELGRTQDQNIAVSFVKRSGEEGKQRDVRAALVLVPGSEGRWLIVSEDDVRPEAAVSAASSDACQSKAAEVANALPEVKRAVEEGTRAADKSGGRAHFGGIGPNDDGDGGIVGSLGIHTDERFESQVVYSVDRKGHLSVIALGTEVSIPSAALRSVERACRR